MNNKKVDIIFLDNSDSLLIPIAPLSLISYLKTKNISSDYFNLSIEFANHFSNIKNLKKLIKDIKAHKKKTLKNKIFFNLTIKLLNKKNQRQIILYFFFSLFFSEYYKINNYNDIPFISDTKTEYLKKFISNNKIQKTLNIYKKLYYKLDSSKILENIIINNIEFSKKLKQLINSNLIGFSSSSLNQIPIILKISKVIKRINPKINIVLGGSSVSIIYNNKMMFSKDYDNIDYFVLQKGEIGLYKLIKNLKQNNLDLSEISNLIYKKKDIFKHNKIENINNLNILPTPDYKMFLSKYKLNDFPFISNKVLGYETGRGCYWNKCKFCSFTEFNNNSFIEKEPEKVINELKILNKETGFSNFYLINDVISPKFAKKFSELLIKEKLNIKWQTYIRSEKVFDKDILKLMKKSGCCYIKTGLESANEKILKKIQKGIDIKNILEIIKNCDKLDIKLVINIIIGFPFESILSNIKSLIFALKIISKYKSTEFIFNFYVHTASTIMYKETNKKYIKNIKKIKIKKLILIIMSKIFIISYRIFSKKERIHFYSYILKKNKEYIQKN